MIRKFLVCAAAVFVLCQSVRAQAQLDSGPPPRAQVEAFYNQQISPVVEGLLKGSHPVPELGARFSELAVRARDKYSLHFNVGISLEYGHRKTGFASNHVDAGQVWVTLYAPALYDSHKQHQLTDPQHADAIVANTVALSMIHELDHAAHGYTSSPTASAEERAQNEIWAWAETCEKSMSVLAERGLPMTRKQREIYEAWIKAARTTMSQSWNDFIRNMYGY
ncbi:MAG: hypothetical protein WC030_01430 [Candidatus Paceibacterota bacterium]